MNQSCCAMLFVIDVTSGYYVNVEILFTSVNEHRIVSVFALTAMFYVSNVVKQKFAQTLKKKNSSCTQGVFHPAQEV